MHELSTDSDSQLSPISEEVNNGTYTGPENKPDDDVELRGIHIKSTSYDSPNLIFIPEAFDQAENWLQFFTNPNNKVQKLISRFFHKEMFGSYILEILVTLIEILKCLGKRMLMMFFALCIKTKFLWQH